MKIRHFEQSDVAQLLKLMRGLAEFEGYLDQFSVTESDLIERGLSADPQFYCLVAEIDGQLLGYLVYLRTDFTFSLKPNFVMKELFVAKRARGQNVGKKLMIRLQREAQTKHVGQIDWLVLPENHNAKRFYEQIGGAQDMSWERWQIQMN